MQKYRFVEIPVAAPLRCNLTGKFIAPNNRWIHPDAPLIDFELFIMTEGTMYLEFDSIRYTVNKGEFLLIPPAPAPHILRHGFDYAYSSYYWLHFTPCESYSLLNTPPGYENSETSILLPCHSKIPNLKKLLILMRQLQNDVQSGYSQIHRNYMTTTLLCELSNQFFLQSQTDNQSNYQKQLYYEIVDHVKLNTSVMLYVSDIAARFGYNEKYISHLFQKYSGIPLKQFISKCKMDDANYLLSDTSLTIGEISSRLGYTDSHNFTRAYKKYTGLSPSAYRESYARVEINHQ